MSLIKFFTADVQFRFQGKEKMKNLIRQLFKTENTPVSEISIIFCSDDYLLEINNSYLNHDYYTDIITFVLSEKDEPVSGELYISVDRVRDNSEKIKTNTLQEMNRVIIHGCLHLAGYKDKTSKLKRQMRNLEDSYLTLLSS